MINKILAMFRLNGKKGLTPQETEFLPAVMEVTETPPSPVGRTVLWTMIILIVSGLSWSFFAHVDEVAIATGKIIPSGYVKVIQAEDKGVVKSIFVRDGQKVKKGEVLIELNPVMTEADLAMAKKQAGYYALEIDRLMAEQGETSFTPGMRPDVDEKDLAFQVRLYESRRAEYRAKVESAQAAIQQADANLAIAVVNKKKLTEQYEIATDKEERSKSLVEQQAISYFNYLDYHSKRLELEQNLAAQMSEIARLESAKAQSRQTLATVIAERTTNISEKIVEDRKQAVAYDEQLKKAAEKDRYSHIVAPVDGIVTQLAVHTVGGIVTAAQSLMIIVPEESTVEVEAWAANKDIGFITVGQHAEIKVETFSFQKFGTLDGEVISISPDAVEDKEKGRVYRVEMKLDKSNMLVGSTNTPLTPGMSVTAEIKIRQKPIIEFFLDPFRKYQNEGLRER